MSKDELKLELYWHDLPEEKEKAVSYDDLCSMWGMKERNARMILHDLAEYDNGDDFVLIRSSKCKGFYKTDDPVIISEFRKECMNRGKSVLATLRKMNRVLKDTADQYSLENNLKLVRESCGLSQTQVCNMMKDVDSHFDKSLLSRMENSICLPTPIQLARLAEIYGCKRSELVNTDMF